MESLKIIGLTILACLLYGIIHDQVTARICVEYFTIGHPDLFGTQDPTLLAFGWGIVATWWVGAILGFILALAARTGTRIKLTHRDLLKPILRLLFVTACVAVTAGIIGYVSAHKNWCWLIEPMASRVPQEKHVWFLVDLWAHTASYVCGLVGGIVLAILIYRLRPTPSANGTFIGQ